MRKNKFSKEDQARTFERKIRFPSDDFKDRTIEDIEKVLEADKIMVLAIGLNEGDDGFDCVEAVSAIHNIARHEIRGLTDSLIDRTLKDSSDKSAGDIPEGVKDMLKKIIE